MVKRLSVLGLLLLVMGMVLPACSPAVPPTASATSTPQPTLVLT